MAVISIGKSDVELAELAHLGSDNIQVADKLCAFLVAISPILQHYVGVYENAGFSVLIIAILILSIKAFTTFNIKISAECLRAIFPLILFELYTVMDRSFSISRAMYAVFFIWLYICIAMGVFNVKYFLKYATAIISLATVLLIVQYFSHYVLHYTINLRPFSLLVDQNSIWIKHSLQAYIPGRMYRPAAFFLEPSHLFVYSFPVLCLLLLAPGMTRWRMTRALIVTFALLLSTSGMGIVISMGIWGVYFLYYKDKNDKNQKSSASRIQKMLLTALVFLIIVIVAYATVPIFQKSINRIFLNTNGTNAIDGRIRLAKKYITTITGNAIIFGAPNVTSQIEFNLAGFFATYIKWGIIGLLLTYWFYIQGLFKLKNAYFWISAIIVVISFFTAHTHGTFYMMYYIVFLMNGYYETELKKRRTNQ